MNNLAEAWDNIVAFPWAGDNSELPVNSLANIELEEWTVEYHNSRWLDLFKANHSLSSTRLLVDNQLQSKFLRGITKQYYRFSKDLDKKDMDIDYSHPELKR